MTKLNLTAIGTSHTADSHFVQWRTGLEHYDQYVDFENGGKIWTKYLCDKLDLDFTDMSICGIGADTYPSRVISCYKQADVVLIELPTRDRYQLYIEQDRDYDYGELFEQSFWQNDNWEDSVYNLSMSLDLIPSISQTIKFKRINNNAYIPLEKQEIKTYINLMHKMNNATKLDLVYANCVMVNGFLKSQNILPIWFSWNFPLFRYNFDDFVLVNNQINNRSLCDVVEQDWGFSKDNPMHFADDTHLNSKYWKQLVDTYFLEFVKDKINIHTGE